MPETLIAEKVKCYHCGDTCESEPIHFAEKDFCCEGCKTVFEILDQNGLCNYYNLEKHPGLTIKKAKSDGAYAYLDDEAIKKQLTDYRSEELEKVTFRVPQVHCASCVWLLENLYKLAEGISVSKVNFMRKEAYVSYNSKVISLREVVELLVSIGYEPDISLNDAEKAKPKKDRSLLYKIGVAGFAFGNVMLFSFPEYLGIDELHESDFRNYFSYWNLLLSLPVFFYSASGYLKSAWISIKKKQLHLDIPIALGIIALFGRSAYEILTATGAGYVDSMTGLVFFMLTGKWFQSRTYEQLSFERDYKSYFPIAVTKITDEKEQSIPVNKIETGDIIRIRHSEIIPADSILIDGMANIDYSFVSGESKTVTINKGETIYTGGRQTGASITLSVTKKVSQSYLTRLWNHDSFQKEETGKLTPLADRVSKWFTPIILTIGFLSGAYWGLNENWGVGINVFTAVLIVACPCALALSSPFTLGNAMRLLGRNKFYLKNTLAIESIAQVDTIVFDKTGTLTLNSESKIEYHGNKLTADEKAMIYSLASQSSHPLSKLIATYLSNYKNEIEKTLSFFSEETGKGICGIFGNQQMKIGSSKFIESENLSGENQKLLYLLMEMQKDIFCLNQNIAKDLKQ
jgi:P-type Cu+ transporter